MTNVINKNELIYCGFGIYIDKNGNQYIETTEQKLAMVNDTKNKFIHKYIEAKLKNKVKEMKNSE